MAAHTIKPNWTHTGAQHAARRRRPLAPPCGRRLRLRCAALQSPGDLQPSPVAQADRALQSLLESGIRGSMAALFAHALNVDLLDAFHWSAADAALGATLAAPVVLLDALLLLPDGAALAAAGAEPRLSNTPQGRLMRVAGGALSLAREERARYGPCGLGGAAAPAQGAALAAAAQMSEELLLRGVILGFGAAWTASRLAEGGLADATLGQGGPLLSDALRWAIAAGVVAATAMRYSHHANDKVAAMRARRAAEAAASSSRAALLRYEPLETQHARLAEMSRAAAAAGAGGAAGEALERGAALLLGGRFVLAGGAAFAAYLATDNLLASFTAGLTLQLAGGALAAAGQGLRGRGRG